MCRGTRSAHVPRHRLVQSSRSVDALASDFHALAYGASPPSTVREPSKHVSHMRQIFSYAPLHSARAADAPRDVGSNQLGSEQLFCAHVLGESYELHGSLSYVVQYRG